MKLEFTFETGKHRFKCTKCGKCCYPIGLTVTKREREHIIKIINNPRMFLNLTGGPFSYILQTRGRCPFLSNDKLCSIYRDRPIMCVSFPLTFAYLSEDRLLVNFIRCEGYDAEDGETIDSDYALKTIQEIIDREPTFFQQLITGELSSRKPFVPFHTTKEIIPPERKLDFKKFLASLLRSNLRDRDNFRAQAHAFFDTVNAGLTQAIRDTRITPASGQAIILDEDLDLLQNRTAVYFSKNYDSNINRIVEIIDEAERVARRTGVCELYVDGGIKKIGINDAIRWKTIGSDGRELSLKAYYLYFRKRLSPEALSVIVEYLGELLVRVGLGGFPLETPFSIIFPTLREYINNIDFYCNLYSGESEVVSSDAATRAIEDLDTNFALGSIYMKRVELSSPY